MEEVETIKKSIRESVEQEADLSKKEKAAIISSLEKIVVEGVLPFKAMGFSDNMMKFIYGQAYRLYDGGHYAKAGDVFYLLNELNPADPRYLSGTAACHMKLEEWEKAIVDFMVLEKLEPDSPYHPYYLGGLYRKIGKFNASYISYALAKKLCGENPELSVLKERALLNMQALEREGVLAA